MATEFYDEEQAKKIYELEETMVLDDQTAYFLVSCENLTRKINLLSLAKALNGDETSENKELKFYSTSYLDNKVKEMYTSINSMGSHFDEYSNIIEKLQTKIDTSMERFQNIVNSIDPKLAELETKLQAYVDDKCDTLVASHICDTSEKRPAGEIEESLVKGFVAHPGVTDLAEVLAAIGVIG